MLDRSSPKSIRESSSSDYTVVDSVNSVDMYNTVYRLGMQLDLQYSREQVERSGGTRRNYSPEGRSIPRRRVSKVEGDCDWPHSRSMFL